MIEKDLSGLQAATREADRGGEGLPDRTPRFGSLLAEEWYRQYLADGNDVKATAFGTLLRASDAGQCARAMSYKVRRRLLDRDKSVQVHTDWAPTCPNDTFLDSCEHDPPPEGWLRSEADEPSNPPTIADSWRMGIGSMVHEAIEKVLPLAYPGAECEVKVKAHDLDLSMHADVVVRLPSVETTDPESGEIMTVPGKVTVIEIKTINGFGFKRALGAARRGDVPEGPRSSAVLQAALTGAEVDADEIVVLYLSLELIGKGIAEGRGMSVIDTFCAEWTYPRDEYLPLAQREQTRMQAVVDAVEAGELAPRSISDLPKGARITNPLKGAWEQRDEAGDKILNVGNTWQCGYCWDLDRCTADG